MPTIPRQNNERDYFVVRLSVFENQLGITDAINWEWDGAGLDGWFRARRPDTEVPNPRPGVAYKITENYTLISMENVYEGFFNDIPAEKFAELNVGFEDYGGVPSVIFNMGPEHPIDP